MTGVQTCALPIWFGDRNGDQVSLVAIDCKGQGCEKQCSFTGLTVRDAVISAKDELVGGNPTTSVYVANSMEEFEAIGLDEMSSSQLQLDSFSHENRLAFGNGGEGLTAYAMDQVEKRLLEGGCIAKLAGIDLV